jgi:pyrroloquinoline quinone (PQQ) biosynthesis protein C
MMTIALDASIREAGEALAACPALRHAGYLDDADLHRLLLQRRFLSLAFTPFYDVVIDALDEDDHAARLVCRQVLREEYPDQGGNSSSHRELLVDDLVALGVDRDVIRASKPTAATTQAMAATFELVSIAAQQRFRQIAVITTATVYAESLVSAEYDALRPAIEKRIPLEETVFYGPHLAHDSGHAKRLLELVRLRLDAGDDAAVGAFVATVERCLGVRMAFYAQFAA